MNTDTMQDRFNFRIPMFTDKGTFQEFQYIELGEQVECTLCGYNGEPQQSTGLKDKNGKLIYEGDIVQFYDDGILKTMKIIWDNDELDFKAIGLKKSVECYGLDFSYLGCIEKEDSLEVIGNIYQDLLKEES